MHRKLGAFVLLAALALAVPALAQTGAAARWDSVEALGNTQMAQGHYADAIASYRRAIDLGQKDAGAAATSRMYVSIGNANLKLNKKDAAVAAYTKAGAVDPKSAVAYFNLCAVLYNLGQAGAQTIAACDKAIAVDPKKADTYFIKGSVMLGNATIGKDNKAIVPPGTVETLRQYLVLAPNGPHAKDVKDMLDFVK